jgi:hypothetical protein
MRHLISGAVLLCALACSATLHAQQTAGLAIRVVDAADAPVADAQLQLLGTRFAGRADQAGWIRLQGLPAGPALLRISRIGYASLETTVSLAAGATFEADVELASAPVQVERVTARGARENMGLAMSGFYRRKEMGFGVFMTHEDFERNQAKRPSEVFRRMPGVRVVPSGSLGRRGYKLQSVSYGPSLSGSSSRGAMSGPSQRGNPDGGGGGSQCEMQTYLDGVAVQLDDIDQVRLESLGAVEVYRGPSEVPAEFNRTGSVCGVVLMWTRTTDRDPAAARAASSSASRAASPAAANPSSAPPATP